MQSAAWRRPIRLLHLAHFEHDSNPNCQPVGVRNLSLQILRSIAAKEGAYSKLDRFMLSLELIWKIWECLEPPICHVSDGPMCDGIIPGLHVSVYLFPFLFFINRTLEAQFKDRSPDFGILHHIKSWSIPLEPPPQ